jgi:uncharacterized protein (DUF433 family)
MNANCDLVGIGLYTIGDAARLAEVTPARIRGWVQGYAQGHDKPRRPAVIDHRLPDLEGKAALSFRELIEVRFVRHFLRAGVSWSILRRAAREAGQDLLGQNAAQLRFSTDGVTVFADALAKGGDRRARDLVANQYVLLIILEQSIRNEFDLDADNLIRSWTPRVETPLVTIDPRRSFGRPIIAPGVPTSTIVGALAAERGDTTRVAALFDTTEAAVRQAGAFELTLAA